jgi:hypothetical protein
MEAAGSFEAGTAGAEGTEPERFEGDADDRGMRPSDDHEAVQAVESSSCEVSDAEEEDAQQSAAPRQPVGATCEEDFDTAVSDTPCTESGSGSGSEEREPRFGSEKTAATARGAEAQEPDAATDVFTRVHAAADVLNIQRAGSADGLPSGSLEHFTQEIGQQKARSGRRQLL